MKSTHSNILETMIKSLFGITVLASLIATPTASKPEQIKLQPEPVKETILLEKEQETWKCPSCTANEKIVLVRKNDFERILSELKRI